ncbi:MAG: BamA/OMP85 family outer membrane protein [Gemmatimonadales bacterium]
MRSIFRRSLSRVALALSLLGLVPGDGEAQLALDEGLVVRQLSFSGNSTFPDWVLASWISTTRSSWFARAPLVRWIGLGEKRRLNEQEFRRDVERLRLYYRYRGFLEVQVDTTVRRTAEDVYITFRIVEGEPVRVRRLTIAGLDSFPERPQLIADLPLYQGGRFDREELRASADTIRIRLRDRGFPEGRVLLPKFAVDSGARVAEVDLLVESGPGAVIGEITVQGTEKVDSAFVRSLLATEPGQDFRERDIAQSQLNLYRSQLFRFATVALDTAHYVSGAGVVPIAIQVVEAPFYRVGLAAGYGTTDCFRGGAGWTVRNALGHGQIFDISAQVSKVGVARPFAAGLENSVLCSALKTDSIGSDRLNYNVTASFRRPAFLSPANALTLSLFAERRSEYLVYLREEVGGSAALHRETVARIPVTLTYRLSSGRTEASALSFCAFFSACVETDVEQLRQRRPLATLTLGMSRVRVNNQLDPTRGSNLSSEITTSSTVIGSSDLSEFTRLIADGAGYAPLDRDAAAGEGGTVAALHVRAGTVFAPRLALGGGASNFVPPEQRFYAGGPNDVRGFSRNLLGPVVYVVRESALTDTVAGELQVPEDSVETAATGGNSIAVGNLELRFPSPVYSDLMRLALFVDVGTVWERGGTGPGSRPALRVTPGAGIRFVTPLGPVRIDAAYSAARLLPGPLYKVTPGGELIRIRDAYRRDTVRTGKGIVIQFSVGQPF